MIFHLKPKIFKNMLFLIILFSADSANSMEELNMEPPLKILCTCSDHSNILRTNALDVNISDPENSRIVKSMIATLIENGGGAGLAAPQVGISKRIFIASFDRKSENLKGFINPSFTAVEGDLEEGWEACFSVPLTFVRINRWKTIHTTYFTPEGEEIMETLTGFPAKVFQHECDHLNGMLITESPLERKDFQSSEEFNAFLAEIRAADSKSYKK